MNKFLFFLLLICQSCASQTKTQAKINVDDFGNISIKQKTDKPIDTLILHLKSQVDTSQLTFIKKVKTYKGFYNMYLKKKGVSTIEYKYSIPKKGSKNHFITDSVFYFSKNYIAYNKLMDNNSLDLEINLPKNFLLINPYNKKLKNKFDSPDIIAGLFNKQTINGFDVYSLHKNITKITNIVNLIDESYAFFSTMFAESTSKPRIIFMPLPDFRQGKMINNCIILNENILNRDDYDLRIIVHEVAHLWWNNSLVTFKDKVLTEAVSEFLALHYLNSNNEQKLVKELIKEKNYKCEVYNSFNILNKPQKTRFEIHDLSYNFITLLLFQIQNNDNSFIVSLSDLFKTHKKNKTKISNKEFESFIESFGYNNIFEEKNLLPDIYITKSNDSVFINSTKKIKAKVPIELTYTNSTLIDSLDFSSSKKIKVNSKALDKIIIDPNFMTIQDSRLNDIWRNNNTSFFDKNSYGKLLNTNTEIEKISSQIISYLIDDIAIEDLDIDKTKSKWVVSKLEKIKNDIHKNSSNGYKLNGASINFVKEGNNRIELKLIFYNKNYDNSFYIDFKAYTNDEFNLITHITYK